ncbi:MAG: MFS transporter [Thermoplasmata archaeon]
MENYTKHTISRFNLLVSSGLGWMFDAMDILILSYIIAYLGIHYGWLTQEKTYILLANNFGLFFGAIIFGYLSDIWSRKGTFMLTLLIYSLFAGMMGFFSSYLPLVIIRFLMGLGLGGELPVVSTLVSELSMPHQRGQNVVILESFWSYGTILAGILATFILPLVGYSILMWGLSITALYIVYIRRNIPEPLRKQKKISIKDMIKQEKKKLLPMLLAWFAVALGYYGFLLWIPSVLISRGFIMLRSFEFTLFMTIFQIPGYFSAAYLVEKIGRRITFSLYMILSAISALIFSISSNYSILLISGIFLNFFNLGAWGVIYAYTPELFNERNRATATGTCTSMARVGMIIGPYLPGIISFNSSLLIFALVWIIGATVVFLLPETLKKK